MESVFEEIISLVSGNCRKDISVYDEDFLHRTIEKRLLSLSLKSSDEYLEYIKGNQLETSLISDSLSVSYSEFFRNPVVFSLLEQHILPELASRKSLHDGIRVWSAGCAAGQEAYSLAILLNELDEVQQGRISYRIFATDVSGSILEMARRGSFDGSTVQNVKLKHIDRYFSLEGESYTIADSIKSHVCFSLHNLLDDNSIYPPDSIYGSFDIVFCSNVLIYFREAVRKTIIDRLRRSLSAGGLLILGESERAFVRNDENMRPYTPITAIFRKSGRR